MIENTSKYDGLTINDMKKHFNRDGSWIKTRLEFLNINGRKCKNAIVYPYDSIEKIENCNYVKKP